MLFRTDRKPLPWRSDGSRDLIAAELLNDDGRFRRVAAGRPADRAGLRPRRQDALRRQLPGRRRPGRRRRGGRRSSGRSRWAGPRTPSLARRGEILFHDATRSFNQWYSCNTCHSDGHTNGLDFDTLNDGRQDLSTAHLRSRKKVPTLRRVDADRPLDLARLADQPRRRDGRVVHQEHAGPAAVRRRRRGPGRLPRHARLSRATPTASPTAASRPPPSAGEAVFRSAKAAATPATAAPSSPTARSTSSASKSRDDAYRGYNPPSLRGVYDKDPYLHDGRSQDPPRRPRPARTAPTPSPASATLTDAELDDLIAYLKSL